MKKITTYIKKHPIYFAIEVLILATTILVVINHNETPEEVKQTENLPTVSVVSVSDLSTGASGVYAPTAAGNAFVVRSESGGLVKKVATEGEKVAKGTVLAELENSAQLAAVTQAQGAYEAALAGAEQSHFAVDTTSETLDKTYSAAENTLRATLIDVQNIIKDTVDTFFIGSNVNRFNLSSQSWTKKQIEYDLADWSESINSTQQADISTNLNLALDITQRTYNLVDTIYAEVVDEENTASTDFLPTLATYRATLIAARTKVSTDLNSLKSTKLNIESTQSSLSRAESSSTGGNASAVDAQVKQALGVLQAAKSAYSKTIVRAPFSGTVVALNVANGDIVNIGADIAIIKPENTADVERSFDLPLTAVKFTPAGAYVLSVNNEGVLESTAVGTGLVTVSNINVTGLNGDENIVMDVRGLKAGESVNVK